MYTLRIKELRKLNKITQGQLASHLKVSHQSISKWENMITSPDISYLPGLADFFGVSIDILMGLEPLENSYIRRSDRSADYWNQKKKELLAINMQAINDDYMKFLITHVWQINQPLHICDFGCGYGYLGQVLLAHLPRGSSYTGYDISPDLIDHGKKIFVDQPSPVTFVECDLNHHTISEKYDMVVCKNFLQHHNAPDQMVLKMNAALKAGGLMVCIEENRLIKNDGLYIKDIYDPIEKAHILKDNWQSERNNDGRDFYLGFWLPKVMEDVGLKDVAIRSNDSVQYLSPHQDTYPMALDALKTTMLWDKPFTSQRLVNIHKHFQSRNMSTAAIDAYINGEIKYSNYLNNHTPNIVRTLGLFISYGRKSHELNPKDQ